MEGGRKEAEKLEVKKEGREGGRRKRIEEAMEGRSKGGRERGREGESRRKESIQNGRIMEQEKNRRYIIYTHNYLKYSTTDQVLITCSVCISVTVPEKRALMSAYYILW